MKLGALSAVHKEEAQSTMEYHGWEMPSRYGLTDQEFDAATHGAALADFSWYGRLEVSGKDAVDLLHRLSTNDLLVTAKNHVVSTVFTTDKGRIVDFAKLARTNPAYLIVSPGNESSIKTWIDKYTITEDITLRVVTDETAMFSIIGPKAKSIGEFVFDAVLPESEAVTLKQYGGTSMAAYVSTGRTEMVHVLAPNVHAVQIWKELSVRGGEKGLRRMGMEAYEAYRISRGIPGFKTEISGELNPYEAGLVDAINYTKGCYIGQEVIARLQTYQKAHRRQTGLLLSHPVPPGSGRIALLRDGAEVGWLTSSSPLPIHGKILALGVIHSERVHEGDTVQMNAAGIEIRGVAMTTPILLT